MSARRPRLLYLSPVVPSRTGNGLAMRAAAVLEGLARHHSVCLQVAPINANVHAADVPAEIRQLCDEVALVAVEPASVPVLADLDVVHVFRLAMVPFVVPYLRAQPRPFLQLDLDDVESVSLTRIAALAETNDHLDMAARLRRAAESARLHEASVLRLFDRVLVCSAGDRQQVSARQPGADVAVLPNSVRLPEAVPERPHGDPFRFLFVGNLAYYPNADAVSIFCWGVLPRVRAGAVRPVRFEIVGPGGREALRAVAAGPGVSLVGAVPDVAPWYAAADAVVAPIRAGGGTRIKILEAFAHGRPVVSTSMGAEGIEVEAGRHLLIGDTFDAFADHCLRLMADDALGDALAREARALVTSRYTPEALAPLFPPPTGFGSLERA